MRAKPDVVNGDPRSLVNTNGDFGSCSRCSLRGPHFIADNGMGSRRALLGPADVQDGVGKIDLIPTQVYKLGRPQTVAEGDEDHGAVTMTPAVTLGGIDQPVDLGAGQMFPGPIDGVRFTSRRGNCSFYDGWLHQFQR